MVDASGWTRNRFRAGRVEFIQKDGELAAVIVVNCRFLSQEVTGVQRFAEEVLRALLKQRTDLMLIAPPGVLRHLDIGGAPVHQLGRMGGHLWEQLELPRLMKTRFRGALLLSLTNTGPILMRRQVITHHDVTYVRQPATYSLRFRLLYRMLSAVALRRAKAVVTVSQFSKTEISAVYKIAGEKISVVPNAASVQFEQVAAESDLTYFLAVASRLPHKNLDFLVEAFERYIDESGSSTRLRIAGNRPAMAAANAQVDQDKQGQVDWLGRVTDEELGRLYVGARALVFPSLYEGFGVPPLEAQASGCPVLSSTSASLPEVLGESALYFDPRDQSELVRVLRETDTNAETRARLRQRGFQNVERFSWDLSARKLSALLGEIEGDAG
ncbi:glycosyltransferase family 4 protein [Microbacterium sp. A93]|uniref:glycosyltransferase family 4 protein n=1 Tax=Microbacterium sp. A93 TaxID=3450716 RepID=UPI003F435EFB